MSGSRSPWRFPPSGVRDASGVGLHPFSALPLHDVHQIGPDGLGGYFGYYSQFAQWEGPTAEGAAGGWALSGVTGAATIALGTALDGEIVLTADATTNCDPTLQLGSTTVATPIFRYVVGKRLWCFARLAIGTVASTEMLFGLATPDTEPTVTNTFPSDGIFFEKAAAATKFDFHCRQDGTSTERTAVGTTLADATFVVVGFMVDLKGNVIPYMNGAITSAANIVPAGNANLPDAAADVLQFMVGFRGASQTVTLDWLLVREEI